jgi:leucyl aminopeptidase (aminopeptidase T)
VATEPGTYAAPPDIEVGAAPVEATASGRVLVDGSILFLGPAQLNAPVELTFEDGILVGCEGPDAWRLQDALDRSEDERMRNLAEVSIGLNPLSRPGGAPLELEGIVGGAHVALGNNVAYGGSVAARSHIDCVLLRADLELDGHRLNPAP